MKYLMSAFLLFAGLSFAQAQTETVPTDTASGEMTVSSSIVCMMCKNTIEKGMAYEKGVKTVQVDVDANEIFVKYNPKKTTETELKQAINKLGYVADDMKPSKEAYDNLHGCCKADLGKH